MFPASPSCPCSRGWGTCGEHLGRPGIGLSRFSNELGSVHTLGPLSEGEVRELFAGWLDRFGVSATDGGAARWADALVRDSQGWPMHTNHFLAALAEQLVMPGRDLGRLDTANLGAVRHRAAKRRLAYYGTRYDNPLLGRTPRGLSPRPWRRSAAPARAQCGRRSTRSGHAFRLRDMDEAQHVFGVLLERGFLQSVPDPEPGAPPRYGCPIPSLASYAVAREFPPHRAATLGDADALNALVRRDRGALDVRDAMGRTPLHLAAECRWTEVAGDAARRGGRPRRAGHRQRNRARDMARIRLAKEGAGEETRQRWRVRRVRRAGRNGLAADAGVRPAGRVGAGRHMPSKEEGADVENAHQTKRHRGPGGQSVQARTPSTAGSPSRFSSG